MGWTICLHAGTEAGEVTSWESLDSLFIHFPFRLGFLTPFWAIVLLLAPDLPPLDVAALELLHVGRTGDIWFNALELEMDTWVKAVQADDAGMNLIQ